MSSTVLYKCSFCQKYTESDAQHTILFGREQLGGKMVSNEIALCQGCDRVFRKLLKVVSDPEVFQAVKGLNTTHLRKLLLS